VIPAPGAASWQPPHMSKNYYSMFRTTSFPVYGRPYPRMHVCANSFSRSAIADDRRVDQFGHALEGLGRHQVAQRKAAGINLPRPPGNAATGIW